MTSFDIVSDLWRTAGCPEAALEDLGFTGVDPVLPSSFRVGAVAQATIAASALAAAEVWRLCGGTRQGVSVDLRHAAVEFCSEGYMSIDGGSPPALWDELSGPYRCGDGRWVRVHTNFAHHRDGALKLLGCAGERDAMAEALRGWQAEDFENAAAEAGLVVAMMRSPAEWQVHAQGQAVAGLPLFTIEKLGAAPPQPLGQAARPLGGLRVLDLTRIIAGPVCGRALAAHGADVLRVTAPHLPSIAPLVIDTGRGKLSAEIDLRERVGQETLRRLIAEADVFVQGYRPGALADRGFSPEAAAALRPGLVCVSLSAYGQAGPWAGRRGFDSLVQTASGINHAEAEAAGLDRPTPLPCQALDHGSGYLMALGAMAGLMRRATEGGSWLVRVSLAQTGRWLQGLACTAPARGEVAELLEQSESGFGTLSAVRHAARLSETPAYWARPAMPLGSHPPAWPDRQAA
jgi:crotonobetainyl-CoA:carnitine CoA-transferase CaiB-like acyl-CoA transferase